MYVGGGGGSPAPSVLEAWHRQGLGLLCVEVSMWKSGVLTGTPRESRYVTTVTVHGVKSGWKQSSGGNACLSSQTYSGTNPGSNHNETVELYPSVPATMSGGDDNGYAEGNGPGCPPTRRTPVSQQPVDHGGSLGGRCAHSGPPRQRGPFPGRG